MEERLSVLSLGRHTRLSRVLERALDGLPHHLITPGDLAHTDLRNRRILFAASLDQWGMAAGMGSLLRRLRRDPCAMSGSLGAVLLDGRTELYTKAVARALLFDANRAGCAFMGRSLVEATERLRNYDVLCGVHGVDRETAYQSAAGELAARLLTYAPMRYERPNVLLLHASNRASSNTLALGLETADRLKARCDITEISLQEGAVYDCNGCSHRACTHFAQQKTCFYGDSVPETVFPAVEKSDAAILCVPNYNDAPGAYFLALNNRLNALMLRSKARERALLAIVVSGYSGGDLVAQQLLGGFCLNKPFALPPRFAMLETANNPGAVLQEPGIAARLDAFADGICRALCKGL